MEEKSEWYKEEVSLDHFLNFVASRLKMSKNNLAMEPLDSKLYYKLRHNLLKTYVLSNLSLENIQEKPFSSFEELSVNSKRTPDFLQRFGDRFLLIEFTFCNRYESVIKNKEIFSKYDYEIMNSHIPIKDYYLFLSLDRPIEDTLDTLFLLSQDFHLPLSSNVREELEDVYNTVLSITAYLNDILPELLSNNIDVVEVTIQLKNMFVVDEPFPVMKNKIGRRVIKNTRVRSLVKRFSKRLIKSLRSKPNWGSYKIKVNFITTYCYIYEDSLGLDKDSLLNVLELGTDSVLDFITIIGDVYNERDVLSGRNPDLLDEDLDREQDVELVADTSAYENWIISKLHSLPMETVADKDLEVYKYEVKSNYDKGLAKLYKESKTMSYNSNPFIFQPCDFLTKGNFNVKITTSTELTNILIKAAYSKNTPNKRIIDRVIDYEAMDKLNTYVAKEGLKMRSKYRSEFLSYTRMREDKFKKLLSENPDLSDMKQFRDKKSEYKNHITEETKQVYSNRIRLNLTKNGRWDDETEHFRKPKNIHYVYQGNDENTLNDNYKMFLEELFNVSNNTTTDDIFSDTLPIGKTLAENCNEMRTELRVVEDLFRTTRLAHSTLLISQWCYSLMFYSNIKLNKDDFIYDNLGYTDVLLLVKGGKKIRSTRISRFFRLLIPITESQAKIIKSDSNQIHSYNSKLYVLTPWAMLRIDYLKKGFEMYHNFGNYYITSQLESSLDLKDFNDFVSIKVLLMFSQKRKLEVWFSSLRYIFFNSLGTHTDVLNLIKTMPMLDYDSLIYLFQRLFMKNYLRVHEEINEKRLFDIFWEKSVLNFDLMVERFEENLFMTKAPFNPYSEHVRNLKSIFDTHKYFLETVGTLDPMEILLKTDKNNSPNYFADLEECDFNFDSKMSYILGDFAGKYIGAYTNKNEMTEKFNDILLRSYTEISTSKGMRSDKGNFWGKKGHDVVYGEMTIDLPVLINSFPENVTDYNKMIKKIEESFSDKISKIKTPQLYFDAKDKMQYKGAREIYVMSENTKLMQNPLEKFFSKLCSFFPNELIHKPSSSRPKFIHSKMFEFQREEGEMMYCTMDCRKWAPRSNLWKYYFFVQGMAKFLPKNFTNHFFSFWNLMFNKKVKIQSHFVDNLMKNEGYTWIESQLIKNGDDYDLVMPYSFMMGIFNYLSSLMHAVSQIYFSENIARPLGAECNFVAHSDDSAGIIIAKNYDRCLMVYSLYEKFQRTINHLMSRKKCSLSKRAFEIISIMYCDKDFIPMTHKFITNVSLDPKGGGWYDDITAVTGKIVDLYNNGGSYLQCYGLLLTMSELLRKSYHLPRTPLLSIVPLPLGGIMNFHPVHLLLVGSKSQECLLDLIEDEDLRNIRIKTYISLAGDYNPTIANKLNYVFPYYRTHSSRPDLDEDQLSKASSISSLPYKNTMLSIFKHNIKLLDRRYVYSLTGVDSNQIMLSTLFFKCSISITPTSIVSLVNVVDSYCGIYKTRMDEPSLNYTYPKGNYMSYFKQTESIRLKYGSVSIPRRKTCKPVVYNTLENFPLKVSQENMMVLSSIEKWEGIKKVLKNPVKYEGLKNYLMKSIPGSDEEKINYIKNFDPSEKEDRVRSGYLSIPSQVKIDTPSRFFTYTLLYTTRRYKISSQKPQLFTPGEFNLEDSGLEHLKHLYLCFKLSEKFQDPKSAMIIDRSLSKCQICGGNKSISDQLSTYRDYFNKPEFMDFQPSIPFCDYTTTQIRGKNVWYSSADFKIYTTFGSVESRTLEGDIWTIWTLPDPDHLQDLWSLFKIFCNSRGLRYENPVFQDTGFSEPKVAFTDFNTPYIPQTYTTSMVLAHSKIIVRDSEMPRIHRRGRKFYLSDRRVDFQMYSIYDINERLYEKHRLESIKNLIYESDLKIDRELLLQNFDNSKLYKVTMNEELHFSNQSNKYKRTPLLGAPGSFTRALAVSNEKNLTNYRSSHDPGFVSKGAIEFDTLEGVPVLDMFEKVNFTRMSLNEKRSFDKLLSGVDLSAMDEKNLINLKDKMGLESLGNALILHRHIFRNMMAGSVQMVNKGILRSLLVTIFDTLNECIESYPRENMKNEYPGSSKSLWAVIKNYIRFGYLKSDMAILLSRGLLRAKSDNAHKFWSIINTDILLSSMVINNKSFLNMISMIEGMLEVLNKTELKGCLYEGETPKYKYLKRARLLDLDIEFSYETIVNCTYGESLPLILDEDQIDQITGGDDLDDEEELTPRDFEGDQDYVCYCFTKESLMGSMEETALTDFSSITLYSPVKFICYPWLGKGDYSLVLEDGITYYKSSFPGNMSYKSIDLSRLEMVEGLQFNEVLKKREDPSEILNLRLTELESSLLNVKMKIKDYIKKEDEREEKKDSEGLDFMFTKEFNDLTRENMKLEEEKSSLLADMKSIERDRSFEETKFKPRCLVDRESAIHSLKKLNVFNNKVVDQLFPKDKTEMSKVLSFVGKFAEKMDLTKNLDLVLKNRHYGKYNLPGFQGLLDDRILSAELKSIFGDNYHLLLQGNVRMSRSNYRNTKKFIERNYTKADVPDKAMMIFLMSLIVETIEVKESDSWFLDAVSDIISNIDDRLNPEIESIILPVSSRGNELEYTELDIFDSE